MTDTHHLLPKAAAYLNQPDNERISYIRSPRWIGYDTAKEILERLETLLAHPKSHRMPNLLIVGNTNNGKTMLVKRFCAQHPADDNRKGNNVIVPVIFIQAPPVPDEGRFYNAILDVLFAPYKPADRVDRKQFQAVRLMRAVKLQMLIIDEVHHILAGNLTRQKAFLNVIKFLGNELEIPIVAAGTKDAFRAIQTDPQLANRFDHAPLPRWKNDDNFARLLMTFEAMLPLRKPSRLDDQALSNHIYAMSEGYIGEVSRILVEAAVMAVKTGKETIDRKILESIGWVPPSARRKQPEGV
jgi:type II secretory pathway predicted ATPase ExeA